MGYNRNMSIAIKKHLEIYTSVNGEQPFIEWLESIDSKIRYRIKERLDRVALGNFGDVKSLRDGVFELRLWFGSGYRIYFGQENDTVVLLLCGGDKRSQKKDLKKAIDYWECYRGKKDEKHKLSRLFN